MAFVTMIFPWTTYRLPTRELYYVMCGGLWASVICSFSLLKYGHYRQAATGEFPESMEVYPDETPWTVTEISRWYHRAPLRAHCSATDSVRRNFLIG